jgi:uncharacterized protein
MSNFFILLYRFFRHNRSLYFLFSGILIALIILFSTRIRLEENISSLSGKNPDKNSFDYVVSHFKFSDKLVIHFVLTDMVSPPEPALLTASANRFIKLLTEKFDTSYIGPVTEKVSDTMMTGLFSFFYDHLPLYLNDDDYAHLDSLVTDAGVEKALNNDYKILVSPAGFALKNSIMKDPLGITALALQKVRSLRSGDNFVLRDGFITTPDNRNLLLFVTSANPINETSKNTKLIRGIDEILKQISRENNQHIKGEYFGSIAMAVGNADRLKKDIMLTLSIALVLIVLFVGWYFRSIKIPVLSFLPALFGGGFALAALYLIQGTVSAIALGVGSVILGLIVDYALYIINHFRRKGDFEIVLKDMSQTIVLCFLTSAGAFLCLIFLRSGVLHDLGWFASLSVAGAAFFALVLLPHIVSGSDIPHEDKLRITFVDRIAAFSFEKNYWMIAILLILGGISVFTMHKAGFEKDMMKMNYTSQELQLAEHNLERINYESLRNIYLVSTGKNLDEALSSNERSGRTIKDLQDRNLVVQLSGIGELLPSDSLQQKRLQAWKGFWTTGRIDHLKKLMQEKAKKYKFKETAFDAFYGMLAGPFSPLNDPEKTKITSTLLRDWVSETPGITMISTILKVHPKDKDKVYKAIGTSPNLVVFDKQVLTNRFMTDVRHDFDLLVKLSMIFVTLLLIFSFGRIELGLIAALPMFFSWLITLGFMGLTGIEFNIFNIIISSFIFGLGVDYSILMMRGLLYEYKYGTNELQSYKVAIFLSSATTLFGVAALFFAKHPALHSIALMAVVGIVSVVSTAYTFQPLLFNWLFLKRARNSTFPITGRIFVKTIVTWTNIVSIAFFMMIAGTFIFAFFPVSKKKKQFLFHRLFSFLCKCYIAFTFPVKRKLYNPYRENFRKPAVIISNHQSLIETPAFLRLYPKILILTGTWIYQNPVFGPIARMAGYINAESGLDSVLEQIKEKVDEGYSILIFPEAHRSVDGNIQRFHRGAFYLSEKLQLDVLPVLVYGSGDFLGKGWFWGRPGALYMRIMPRIAFDNPDFGTTVSERTRKFRRFYIEKYGSFKAEHATCDYYRRKLMLNFVLKGPVLEWYLRVKSRLEKNFSACDEFLPKEGEILDIGCGYGYITYMLSFTSEKRIITGIDYDEEKISVARHCFSKNDRVQFIAGDVRNYSFEKKDAFLLYDIMHYLPEESQEELLRRCIENLRENGIILIREANKSMKKRHRRTKLTELISTRTGFNKTMDLSGTLYFTSAEQIAAIVSDYGMQMDVVDNKKVTSNLFFLIHF